MGREQQIRAGLVRLERTRLLTLLGPGGVGKTRLAARLVRALARTRVRTQVRWCSLSDVQDAPDAASVERTVAEALGAELLTEHSARRMILDRLAECDEPVLLVLDNCEHVVAAAGSLVSALLAADEQVQILVTSREALGCAGEELFDVPPLTVGGGQSEALELFEQRAKAVGVVVQAAEREAAAQLCQRLDGLPLAIELAAAGLRSQSVNEILARLDGTPADQRFRLLTGGPRHGAHPMHHSIQAVVEWSYRLCTTAEQALWTRLSVFEGGWNLAAAEAVCTGPDLPVDKVLTVITELVGKSVVIADRCDGTTRYRMLETLRQYGSAQLTDADELRRRHRDYLLAFAREAADQWFGEHELTYLRRAHSDLANLRAALAWSTATPGEEAAGLELSVSLARLRLQFYLGNSGETIDWLRDGLTAVGPDGPAELRLWAVTLAGVTALCQGDLKTADDMLTLCRAAPVDPDDIVTAALTARFVGLYAFFAQGDPRSIAALQHSVELFEQAGPGYAGERATSLLFAGLAADWYGSDEQAAELTSRYAAETKAVGANWAYAWALLACGLAVIWHGNPRDLPPIERPRKEPGDHWGLLYLIHLIAWRAAAVIKHQPTGPESDHANALRAARALGGAHRLGERYRVALSVLPPFRDANAEAERVAVQILGRTCFDETFQAAQAREYADLAALVAPDDNTDSSTADGVDNNPKASRPDAGNAEGSSWLGGGNAEGSRSGGRGSRWGELTPTEQQVALLAAQGFSDAQIARRRVCSVRTVEKHLENTRRKLLVESRHGIAQWIPTAPAAQPPLRP